MKRIQALLFAVCIGPAIGLGDCDPIYLSPGITGSLFGQKVAVHAGTHRAAVSAPEAGDDGAVYVFDTQSGALVHTLTPSQVGNSSILRFGNDLAFSDNGQILAIGAPGYVNVNDGSNRGAVYIFDLQQSPSSEVFILGPDESASQRQVREFGTAVAISQNKLVVGAPRTEIGQNVYQGTAYIYDLTNLTIDPTPLIGSETDREHAFGSDVAIDGGLVAIAAIGHVPDPSIDPDATGAVYIFQSGVEVALLEPPGTLTIDRRFGHAIDVSGSTIAVSDLWLPASGSNGYGAYYVYSVSGPSVSLVTGPEFLRTDLAGQVVFFGFDLSLSGTDLVVSAPRLYAGIEPQGAGSAVIVDLTDSSFAQVPLDATLTPAETTNYGASVAIDAGEVVVGRLGGSSAAQTFAMFYAGGCNVADVARPYCILDLQDTTTFSQAHANGDPLADIAAPFGVVDLADIVLFVSTFNGGCP